jgi:ergothioneine biosynthesis protein EgtB
MKFGKKLTIMEKTFKDRGEIAYIISPNKEFFSSPFIPSRESPYILEEFKSIRQLTIKICENLYPEDFVLHAMGLASSTKWHLAHSTWFFESYILKPYLKGYVEFNPVFHRLFRFCPEAANEVGYHRWNLSRPSVDDIYAYRTYVDAAVEDLLVSQIEEQDLLQIQNLLETAIQYEASIQERILTDIKYNFSLNLLHPAYEKSAPSFQTEAASLPPMEWVEFSAGLYNIGFEGDEFALDHERPRHTVYLNSFALAKRLVSNREYREFIDDGGYRKKELWLSDGWKFLQETDRVGPLYWKQDGGVWSQFTLRGVQPLIENEPVSHISYYEAAAFARWVDARLPTESEWEVAASNENIKLGNFFKPHTLQPIALKSRELIENKGSVLQLFGDVWEWTGSAFLPYPGFQQFEGSPGDYHSKFMSNQMVLRGGSCLTQEVYYRTTYRQFLYPFSSWYCSGIRLAKEV